VGLILKTAFGQQGLILVTRGKREELYTHRGVSFRLTEETKVVEEESGFLK